MNESSPDIFAMLVMALIMKMIESESGKKLHLHNHCSLYVLHLEPPDEDVNEVDEGEFYESAEDRDEAEDDKDVHGGRVPNL